MNKDELNTILLKAKNLCAKSEKCISDIVKYLEKYNLSEKEKESIIQELISEKYIDNKRYARAFVNDKLKLNKWGKQKIKHYLLQKKIPLNIITEVNSEIEKNEYQKILYSILIKKVKELENKNDKNIYEKTYRYAISRGFESDLIYATLDSILNKG